MRAVQLSGVFGVAPGIGMGVLHQASVSRRDDFRRSIPAHLQQSVVVRRNVLPEWRKHIEGTT